jgi:hypothetical protein
VHTHQAILGSVAALVAVAAVSAGCVAGSEPGAGTGRPTGTQLVRAFPAGCSDFGFAPKRCDAIVSIARQRLAIDDRAATVELLSDPQLICPTDANGRTVLCVRSGGRTAVIVRITAPGGVAREAPFNCGVGSQGSIACSDHPVIQARTPIDGYHDIACGGEDAAGNPTNCATPLPSIDPSTSLAARPLNVSELDIPIDHDGRYEVRIGTAGIANGVLVTASFTLAQPSPDRLILDEDGVSMRIRPADPTDRPFENYYQHGWYPGVEEAEVFLDFNVIGHDPGAILQIRDLTVE